MAPYLRQRRGLLTLSITVCCGDMVAVGAETKQGGKALAVSLFQSWALREQLLPQTKDGEQWLAAGRFMQAGGGTDRTALLGRRCCWHTSHCATLHSA